MSWNDAKDDAGDGRRGTDVDAAAAAASQAQVVTNPTQPVAAAVANASENGASAPANGPATSLAIGEPTKARATSTLAVAADQNASTAQDATDTALEKQPPSTAKTDSLANAAPESSAEAAKTQAASGSIPQQAPTQPVDDATASPQTAGPVPAETDHATARAGELSVVSSSDADADLSNVQGGTGAAKTDIDGLPNFGFSASSATTPSTIAAATPSDTAAAVPIAGLAVAIAARAQAGSNQFEIKLAPPELGSIDVKLDIDRDGQVTSHMTVERADTLQLLQSQQPQLERALEQAGLKTADNGLQFTLRDQSFAGQNNGSGSPSMTTQLVIPEPDLAPITAAQVYTRAGLGSGVDIRV